MWISEFKNDRFSTKRGDQLPKISYKRTIAEAEMFVKKLEKVLSSHNKRQQHLYKGVSAVSRIEW